MVVHCRDLRLCLKYSLVTSRLECHWLVPAMVPFGIMDTSRYESRQIVSLDLRAVTSKWHRGAVETVRAALTGTLWPLPTFPIRVLIKVIKKIEVTSNIVVRVCIICLTLGTTFSNAAVQLAGGS